MRARDIIGVCLLAARRLVGTSVRSRRGHAHEHCFALAIVLACCVLTDLAHADKRSQALFRWPDEPPSGADCLTHSDLEQRIERQLGGPLSEADFAFSFTAHIERTSAGFRLVLVSEHDGEHGERTFEGATCREVSDAAVLLIALSLDDARASQGAPTPEAPGAAAQGNATTQPAAPSGQVAQQAHGRPAPRWGVRTGGLLDVGTLPRAAAGIELGGSLAWARSRFTLSGLGLPPVRSQRAADGSRVQVALWAARLGYCHTLLATRVSLGACLGLELGRASGHGVDLGAAKRPESPWAAGWLAVRVAVALDQHWALALEPGLVVPTKRGRFVSSDAQGGQAAVLHTAALIDGRLWLALELSF